MEEQDEELINPSKSWAQFMSQNEDTGSEFEKDFGISPKSAGSEVRSNIFYHIMFACMDVIAVS